MISGKKSNHKRLDWLVSFIISGLPEKCELLNCTGLGFFFFFQRKAMVHFSNRDCTFCTFFSLPVGEGKKLLAFKLCQVAFYLGNLLSLLDRGKQTLLWGAYLRSLPYLGLTYYFPWFQWALSKNSNHSVSWHLWHQSCFIYNLYDADDFSKMIKSIIFIVSLWHFQIKSGSKKNFFNVKKGAEKIPPHQGPGIRQL